MRALWCALLGMLCFSLFLGGCGPGQVAATPTVPPADGETGVGAMAFQLTSDAFGHGQAIPGVYTCQGEGLSPPLQWSEAPTGTESYVLIVDDPDAPRGTFTHWVLCDLPDDLTSLPEDLGRTAAAVGGVDGRNSAGTIGYSAPCPPSGTHHYLFRLYALDSTLGLSAGATRDEVLKAMEGHILGRAELMGTVSK